MIRSKALYLSLLLIFLSACSDPTVDRDELVERDGVFYEKFSNEPYTGNTTGRTIGTVVAGKFEGEVLTYHENGQLESLQVVARGVGEGEFREFDEEGNLLLVALLADGEFNGEARFYDSGEFAGTVHYKMGVRHGLFDSRTRKGNYAEGLMVGKWEFDLPIEVINMIEEQLTREKSGGRHPSARFHLNGQVAESGMRENGVKVGTWYYYDDEGVLTGTSEFVGGTKKVDRDELLERDGVLYESFSTEPFNGEVVGSTQGRVVNGRWNGTVLQFMPEGDLSLEENYVDGVLNGEQLFYDDNSLRLREIFINGEKVKATRFRRGIITSVSNYLDGVEHGAYEVFYPNGNTMYRIHYDNGNRIEDVIDVFASDGKTQIKVPVSQGKDVHWLYADGAVEIVGNDDCAVRYDKGRDPLLIVDIEFDTDDPLVIERNKQRVECTEVIEKIIDDASLTNYVVENLFPSED